MCNSFSIPDLYKYFLLELLCALQIIFCMLHLQISCAKDTILKIKENYFQAQTDVWAFWVNANCKVYGGVCSLRWKLRLQAPGKVKV